MRRKYREGENRRVEHTVEGEERVRDVQFLLRECEKEKDGG